MKIMFDSNVWRRVILPKDFQRDEKKESIKLIHESIISKKIEPYISETIFSIEGIQRKKRKERIAGRQVDLSNPICDGNKTTYPFKSQDPENLSENSHLDKYFKEALKLGFKIVRFPRIAMFSIKEVDNARHKMSAIELKIYHDEVFPVSRAIEAKGCGIAHLKNISSRYQKEITFNGKKMISIVEGIANAPESETGIARACAEWADGDSVAISIALKCDYFCTEDKAVSAGTGSILSKDNLKWLKETYNFNKINIEELSKLVKV